MTKVNETVVSYLAAWNERDAKKRRELVAKTWTEDGTYVDSARNGKGHAGIDAMIAKTQETFVGYRLSLASGIEAFEGHARFTWAAGGTAEAPLFLKGADFAEVAADGRFKSVTGFTDAAPAH